MPPSILLPVSAPPSATQAQVLVGRGRRILGGSPLKPGTWDTLPFGFRGPSPLPGVGWGAGFLFLRGSLFFVRGRVSWLGLLGLVGLGCWGHWGPIVPSFIFGGPEPGSVLQLLGSRGHFPPLWSHGGSVGPPSFGRRGKTQFIREVVDSFTEVLGSRGVLTNPRCAPRHSLLVASVDRWGPSRLPGS